MGPVDGDIAAVVLRFLADHGPLTAADVAKGLGADGAQVAAAMALLLDARWLVVAGVTPEDEPLYGVSDPE